MQIDLNNKIEGYEEREQWVQKEVERIGADNLSSYQLDKIASYLIDGTNPVARGEIITANRMVTVNKRETSQEGLMEKLEGGESAFHQLIKQDKNAILTPKVEITQKDIEEVPLLAQLREAINDLETQLENPDLSKKAKGKLKQTIIELRRDQYVFKNSFRQPMFSKGSGGNIEEHSHYDISLHDKDQVLILLLNYDKLKLEFEDAADSDMKWILDDLDRLINKSLQNKPTLLYILQEKIRGSSNNEIREGLIELFDVDHTQEYISSLYRNKIPQTIAEAATEEWVNYIYMNKLKGSYKKCSKCKQIKLANNRNFSINRTSSSQWYSVCKKCRNTKKTEV